MDPIRTQGVKIKRFNGATYDNIPGIIGWSAYDGEAKEIPTTDLDDVAVRRIKGLPDNGRLTLRAKWDPNNAIHAALVADKESDDTVSIKVDFNTTPAQVDTFNAFVMKITPAGEVDDIQLQDISILIDGVVTHGSS